MRHLHALGLVLLLALSPAAAHELKPVYVALQESADGRVQVRFKVPQFRDGSAAAIQLRMPADCHREGARHQSVGEDSVLQVWTLRCEEPLAGRSIRIDGLSPRVPDGVVLLRDASGRESQAVISRHQPEASLQASGGAAVGAYLGIGVEHILLGIDHLLFMFGLLLLWRLSGARASALVLAVTAFTLAHSLTLALSVLGGLSLPSGPVEALIALSILMLAVEIARALRMSPQIPDTLAFSRPWLLAFVFGLLHGFGFAGALAETGLPGDARALALLLFNLGVELGQLLFIGALILLHKVLRSGLRLDPMRLATTLTWIMGSVSAAWTLDRSLQIFGA